TLCSAKDERPCTVHGEDGEYFDLNPLKASTDYTFQSPGGREFIINVCRSVVSETWSPKVDDPDNIAAFTRDFGGIRGDFSLG
ncbi:hypothetical protein PUNSTDRAFT_21957, partial [Punctularia strigosozonata HHB-11173 SS5]|uniref:uncharacterized protein n=1 Tax=Punctularia strigosozonata (strain HHB-11173) TaxID=741275 RepID=UPI0004416A14